MLGMAEPVAIFCDLPIFAGLDDKNPHFASGSLNIGIKRGRLIAFRVDFQS
jgi:hypothetical protein